MNTEIIKNLKERAEEMLDGNYYRKIGDGEIYTIICELENFCTAYEKEKEKNMELTNSYNQAIKETNEENRRCMLLAVENQDLKEKNKELNILRLELLISQFPDTTETYKKYKKELDELLKEE